MAGIIRDFSQQTIDTIAELVQKEEQDGQWGFFDWVDDTFTSAGDIENSLNHLTDYQKEVIDQEDIGTEKFDTILKEVEAVDQNYASRFYNLYDKLEGFKDKLSTVANMITPGVMTTTPENFNQIVKTTNDTFEATLNACKNNIEHFENELSPVLEGEPNLLQKIGSGTLGFGVSALTDSVGSLFTGAEDVLYGFGIGDGHSVEASITSLGEIPASWDWVDDQWYYGGRAIGDGVFMAVGAVGAVVGIATMLSGVELTGGGLALSATGIFAEIGLPAVAVSGAVVLEGAAVTAVSGGILMNSAHNFGDNWHKMSMSEKTGSTTQPSNHVNANNREALLESVSNQKLKNAVNQIYRPGATVGDGGLADAIKHELKTGELVGGKSHITKGKERIRNLENIINKQNLNTKDLEIAKQLLHDLKNALGG